MPKVLRSLGGRAVREVRRHPGGYLVIAGFTLAGPFLARMVFPEAPLGAGLAGGLLLGVWSALCATPAKLIDD